jgi:hypothetical protein
LVYADDVSLMEDIIETIKRNTETLTDASKEVGLQVNVENTKYILVLLSLNQNEGQNHDIKIANGSFENVVHFKYLRTSVLASCL